MGNTQSDGYVDGYIAQGLDFTFDGETASAGYVVASRAGDRLLPSLPPR